LVAFLGIPSAVAKAFIEEFVLGIQSQLVVVEGLGKQVAWEVQNYYSRTG